MKLCFAIKFVYLEKIFFRSLGITKISNPKSKELMRCIFVELKNIQC